MIVAIDEDIWFPSPYLGERDGFFAVGGDLSIPRLMLAYANGIFPWYAYKKYEKPYWCCPLERFVIIPGEVHVSHSMRTLMNKNRYHITMDEDFRGVMQQCRKVNSRNEDPYAWLGQHIVNAYVPLFNRGKAHSVEVWEDDKLVGGLYGVQLSNEVFVGESMFSIVPNGSKIALISLARYLEEKGTKIIDCQCHTPHLQSMGGKYMPYAEYISVLHSNPEIERITRVGENGFLYLDYGPKRCRVNRYLLTDQNIE
jgi:leucyl/phenylalanyl-tRNA--protein transferase